MWRMHVNTENQPNTEMIWGYLLLWHRLLLLLAIFFHLILSSFILRNESWKITGPTYFCAHSAVNLKILHCIFVALVTSETREVTLAAGFRRKFTVCLSSSRFLCVFLSCLRFFSSLVSMWPDAQPPVGSIPQRERMKREGSRRHEEEKTGRNRGRDEKSKTAAVRLLI